MEQLNTFNNFNLPTPLSLALKEMQFLSPTPVQAATIPPALQGKDILGTAQTGTGKTGAFGVPLLASLYPTPGKQALILAPTRELAAQIFKVLRKMSTGMDLEGALLVGGESFQRQVSDVKKGVDYLVATPGRLNDHLEQRTVKLSRVGILVIDEVDRMMDMGFAPQIEQVLRHVPHQRQTLVFSATLPESVSRLVAKLLRNPVRVAIGSMTTTVSNVKEEIIHTTDQEKANALIKEIQKREGRILVFARTKIRTERLARVLYRQGISVVSMHGGYTNSQRKTALRRYHSGDCRIMIATDLAGRGIDVADIEHVINYDMPNSREDYIHRAGRTARIGKAGNVVTFATPTDFDAEEIVFGKKKAPRVVFSGRPRRRR